MAPRISTGASAVAPRGPAHNPNNDVEITSPPADSISSLNWSPAANLLVASSWDNEVRCWEVWQNGGSIPRAVTAHNAPVLCTAWSPDGTTVFSGGCDKQAKMWSLATNQSIVVAQHDAPIRDLYCVEKMNNMLVTGSWDRTVRYWDLRQQNPVHIQWLPERVYSMDIKYPLLVVGTANRRIQVYDLTNPQTVFKDIESPLRYQTRCVAAFPDATGYLVVSIEGYVAVHHVQDQQQAKNFLFKCHRDTTDAYAVNSMAFHPQVVQV